MPFPLVKMRFDPIRTVACRTGRQTGSAVTFPVTSTRARPWFALRTLTRSLGLANGWLGKNEGPHLVGLVQHTPEG